LENYSYDIVIKKGILVDGSGNPWYNADVGIKDGKIKSIGKINEDGKEVIEADGLVVAPGFIDTHSHSDLMLLVEPEAMPKIMQGITTEIIGQDGLGEAPIREDVLDDWRKYLSGLNGDPDVEWNWKNFGEYLKALDLALPATNIAALVGHGNLRLLAMGMENRSPTLSEMNEMKKLLADSMKEGAFGLSTGLIYPPCVYANSEELSELCKVAMRYGGIFFVHMRNEGSMLLESINEVVEVGRNSGIPVHISHFKASGEPNWGKTKYALEALEIARSDYIDVTIDQYPYVAGSTFLSSLLPVWAHEGGTERMLERLKDGYTRKKIAVDISSKERGPNWGWKNILVVSVKTEKNRIFEGETMESIANKRMQPPLEALFDIILEEENAATMVSFNMSEEDVKIVMTSPLQMVCTDGIALGKPHPRAYGSFPRILGRYVKEGVLRLEEAIKKMTSLPAQTMGLFDRGMIKPGMIADITIFNPETILDTATYKDSIRFPKGIEYVIVNGELTVKKGTYTGKRNGVVLRNKTNN
jgi:N-acyl-D-amino-acid deacylase